MRKNDKLFYTILVLFVCIGVNGQIANSDSTKIVETTNDFYEWYIYSTRHENNIENRPEFVRDASGFICLDYTKYITNLRKYSFTDSLIIKEILTYKECEENLRCISISEFAKFDDLDDFERIGCAFSNSYKWIGGQEMIDGITINEIEFLSKSICHVTIEYYSNNRNEKSFWGNKTLVKLKKCRNTWKIFDINI
jgi:hypothetical protein